MLSFFSRRVRFVQELKGASRRFRRRSVPRGLLRERSRGKWTSESSEEVVWCETVRLENGPGLFLTGKGGVFKVAAGPTVLIRRPTSCSSVFVQAALSAVLYTHLQGGQVQFPEPMAEPSPFVSGIPP